MELNNRESVVRDSHAKDFYQRDSSIHVIEKHFHS